MTRPILRRVFDELTTRYPDSQPPLRVINTDKKLKNPEWRMLGSAFQSVIRNAGGRFSVEVYESDTDNTKLTIFRHEQADPYENERVCYMWCKKDVLAGYRQEIDDPHVAEHVFVYAHLWQLIGELQQRQAQTCRVATGLVGEYSR